MENPIQKLCANEKEILHSKSITQENIVIVQYFNQDEEYFFAEWSLN